MITAVNKNNGKMTDDILLDMTQDDGETQRTTDKF